MDHPLLWTAPPKKAWSSYILMNSCTYTNYWCHLLDGIKIFFKKFLIFIKIFNGPKFTPKNQEFEQLASTFKQPYTARTKWYHFFFWQCPDNILLDYCSIMKLIKNFTSGGCYPWLFMDRPIFFIKIMKSFSKASSSSSSTWISISFWWCWRQW